MAASWIIGTLTPRLNKENLTINASPITAKQLAELLTFVADNTISNKIAKEVFESMWKNQGSAAAIIEQQHLQQLTDSEQIEKIIDEIIDANPTQLQQYRAGKEKLFAFFVGQVMRATQGRANPQQINAILREKLRPNCP